MRNIREHVKTILIKISSLFDTNCVGELRDKIKHVIRRDQTTEFVLLRIVLRFILAYIII
jgi:hypothetical protein